MRSLKLSVCGGLLSALAWSASTSIAHAQGICHCNQASNAQGMVYESGAIESAPMNEADALLAEVDNPAELINLTVIVQDKAIVSINGEPTVTMGTSRPYIVRGLKAGKTYKFEIEGLLKNESGAEYAAKESVTLKAGESKQVVLHLRRRIRAKPPVPPMFDPRFAAPAAAAPPAK